MAMARNQLIRYFSISSARKCIQEGSPVGKLNLQAAHKGGYKLWKNMFFFVAFPAVGLCMANAYLKHKEEAHEERPEFVKYDYLRMRTKRFPWGDGTKSLFHNPHVNPLPDGYEE